MTDKKIEARDIYRALSAAEVAAEFNKADFSPVKAEVLRLTAAYLNFFRSQHGITAAMIRDVSPQCCNAVEAAALKQAAQIARDASLFLALKELFPGEG
jgi:hypothetical protein